MGPYNLTKFQIDSILLAYPFKFPYLGYWALEKNSSSNTAIFFRRKNKFQIFTSILTLKTNRGYLELATYLLASYVTAFLKGLGESYRSEIL